MPVCYTEWKVLPHRPIEKLASNLWRVSGKMEGGVLRTMVLARLKDGRVLVHNAIALDDGEMAELDAWGEVAGIVVPNGFHRMDSRIWKDRYPKAKVYCPGGATGWVKKAVPPDGTYADAPSDDTVSLRHLAGLKEREGVMDVQTEAGLVSTFCDSILNVPPETGMTGLFLHPTGQAAVPRFVRWFLINDKSATKAELERIAAADGLCRVIPGHGADITEDIGEKLKGAAALLG